jgi:hypothetical protein
VPVGLSAVIVPVNAECMNVTPRGLALKDDAYPRDTCEADKRSASDEGSADARDDDGAHRFTAAQR